MMDSSYWRNSYSGLVVRPTRKLFYGQFLWRICMYIPGSGVINQRTGTVQENIEFRMRNWHNWPNYNWAGSWGGAVGPRPQLQNSIDLNQLLLVQDLCDQLGKQIRVRIEEPHVQFYANDEQTIRYIAERFAGYPLCVMEVNGPENDRCQQLLISGAIIRQSPASHRYKINLRDGRYGVAVKQQILTYIDSLGDQIHLTDSCRHQLRSDHDMMWNVHFLTNDSDIRIFLSLINPNLVRNFHELVVPD